MKKYPLVILLLLSSFFMSCPMRAQDSLRIKIERVTKKFRGDIGVAILHLENGDTLSVNGERAYPMQSVYKFPLSLAILRQVDQGVLSLDKKIHIAKENYFDTWSPIMKKYPEANVDLSVSELIQYVAGESDNVGCDVLFDVIGGPKKADFYIHSLGVKDLAIVSTEREMHETPKIQFENWSSPRAMVQLLNLFYQKKILQPATHQLLWDVMVNTYLGKGRIKGKLPVGTIIAHRTGTGAPDENGNMTAVNDVGIVTLPNGNHFAIVVFITNTPEDTTTAEAAIADISRTAYDHFSAAKKTKKKKKK
jgi:beta-lactamase class A